MKEGICSADRLKLDYSHPWIVLAQDPPIDLSSLESLGKDRCLLDPIFTQMRFPKYFRTFCENIEATRSGQPSHKNDLSNRASNIPIVVKSPLLGSRRNGCAAYELDSDPVRLCKTYLILADQHTCEAPAQQLSPCQS